MNRFTAMLVCLAAVTASAEAAEVKVLSAGAIEPGLRAAAAAWRKQSGHEVQITFNTAPQIQKRVSGGEVSTSHHSAASAKCGWKLRGFSREERKGSR